MVIFKSKQNKFEGGLKIKLCDKRLYPTESFKYLSMKLDTNLNDFSMKLNRANALLFKIRKYVSLKIILLFLTPTYPTAVLSEFRTTALFTEL